MRTCLYCKEEMDPSKIGPFCSPICRWRAAQPKLDLEKPLVNYVGWKKKPIAPVDLDEH